MRIAGGLVVTPEGAREADVVVADGRVAALEPASSAGDLDARGCLVLPGGVDPHVHALADVVPATRSALHGGTTTVLSFTAPRLGESPAAAFERAARELVPLAASDVHLHPAIWEPDRLTRVDLEELRRLGATSVKLFLAYPELGMTASDRTLYETLRDAARLGLLVQVHCENAGAIEARVDEALAEGRTDARAFVWTRPPEVEEEAVARTLALARLARAPVYLVHLSTAGSLELVRAARARGQLVWAEACTHHLLLDESRYDDDVQAERYLIVPPLRSRQDVEALWAAVADGTIDTIGSDHAQVAYRPDGSFGDFRSLPYGFPGVEVRVPLVLSEGTRRGISPERLAGLLASAPARAFGLARKGAIEPGAGADLIVWDPREHWTIRASELHDGWAETPYAGIPVQGRIRHVLRGGERVQ